MSQATFSQLEKEMKEVTGNAEALKKNYLELTELRHILRKTQTFFEEVCMYILRFPVYVPKVLCYEGYMLPRFYIPKGFFSKALFSKGSMFQMFILS